MPIRRLPQWLGQVHRDLAKAPRKADNMGELDIALDMDISEDNTDLHSGLAFRQELEGIVKEKKLREELLKVIGERQIHTLYQPIVDLRSGRVAGYEALSRGPAEGMLYMPDRLFTAAAGHRVLFALEQVCREAALKNFMSTGLNTPLFLNISADVITDPKFKDDATDQLMIRYGLTPQDIVFEITGPTVGANFVSMNRSLAHYRKQGYRIAVDDVGAGYSGLQAIAELQPDYIKMDMSMIKDIDKNPVKQSILEAMLKLSFEIGSTMIAEGVETPGELTILLEAGIPLAQGYLLARPGYPPVAVNSEALQFLNETAEKRSQTKGRSKESGLSMTIGEIVEQIPTVSPDILVSDVETIFANPRVNGVAVLDGNKPVGLLMKHKLYYQLGTHYGVSLYHRRPVKLVMDCAPLIVPSNCPLESVPQVASKRNEYNLYDLIIVVEDNHYVGAVSIMNLLTNINQQQIRCAHSANPLTGLPGNLVIETRLKAMVESFEAFAVLYLDLDNFKAYNDKYGFEMGDKALLTTAQVLSHSLSQLGRSEDFIGHVGGDDFIIITKPEYAKQIADTVIALFDVQVRELYQQEDLKHGYIEVKNRRGQLEQFPVMSISIAGISSEHRKFNNYLEVAEAAAELKRLAKQIPGSKCLCDRRHAES